jgi:hypothetical protein
LDFDTVFVLSHVPKNLAEKIEIRNMSRSAERNGGYA